ncbi:MAG: hypothetical protein J6S67_13155 [Methanobrevibacter sp.]|nr:hypothetical protein [Methanobrevibacter sp.]
MGKLEELKEIITLSKETGVSLSEAISVYKEYQANSADSPPKSQEVEQPKKTEEQDTGREQPEGAPKNERPPETDDNVIDYKKKVEELENKIRDLQSANVQKDVSGQNNQKSNEDIVNDLTASFM